MNGTTMLPSSVITGAVLTCCKVTRQGLVTTSRKTSILYKKPNPRLVYPLGERLKSSFTGRTDQATVGLNQPFITDKPPLWPSADHHQGVKNPVPDFNDARAAYEEKTTRELLRAATCFRLCQIPWLVNNAETLLNVSRRLLGGWVVRQALQATMYGHFCAGEDKERIRPVLKRLERAGVGSILDYVAEADPNEGGTADLAPRLETKRDQTIQVREYNYESEAKCDDHVKTFLQCIRAVASMGTDGYAAIKVTALGNPKLLARLSVAIEEAKGLFEKFDENGDGVISRKEFESGYKYVVVGDFVIFDSNFVSIS
jgi:hypothetical protein